MAPWVKDLILSLLWLSLQLWRGFDPWPRNFHMLWVQKKKKKKKKDNILGVPFVGISLRGWYDTNLVLAYSSWSLKPREDI